jgi:hypothetical protein
MQDSANFVASNGCLYLDWTRRLTVHHTGLCIFCGLEWLCVPGLDSEIDPPPCRPLQTLWPRMAVCTWAGLTDCPSTMQASANYVASNGCGYLGWTHRLPLHHAGLCKLCGLEKLPVPGLDSQIAPPPGRPLQTLWPRMAACTWGGLTDCPSTMQASANSVASKGCLYLGWTHRLTLHRAGLCKFCGLERLSAWAGLTD